VSTTPRSILVTGAAGYIGSRLATRLLAEPGLADARFAFTDAILPALEDPRAECVAADLTDADALARLLDRGPDLVYHLAGVLGGGAEANYPLSRRVNIDATLNLFERLGTITGPPRLVYASSVGVFGPPLPAHVDDDTLPQPLMHYGAQKRMMEVALEQMSARGLIDGIALRLPGIVAHPAADARLRSAFLNTMFYDYAAGRDIVLPVSEYGTTWLISIPACMDALVHAGRIPTSALGRRRAFTLPAQTVTIGGLVAALARLYPDSGATVRYAPQPDLDAQFASQPPLTTGIADALGFRHDGSVDVLVSRAIEGHRGSE
jgi:nucleoside-diphosphate-sugar epimerase